MRGKVLGAAALGVALWLAAGPRADGRQVRAEPVAVPAPAAEASPAAASTDPGAGLPGTDPSEETVPRRARVDCAKARCVALTFDDGPGSGTLRLLRMLDEAHVRVTFFVVGPRARAAPGTVARAHAAGHEIGDHTERHALLTRLPSWRVRQEIDGTRRTIRRLTGSSPVLLRPPYGATDRRVTAEARRLGLAQILWDVDTRDWADRDSSIVARRAIKGLHRGAIILMHDIHPTTVAAVPRILRAAKAGGYTLVTVSELLGTPRPGKVYTSAVR